MPDEKASHSDVDHSFTSTVVDDSFGGDHSFSFTTAEPGSSYFRPRTPVLRERPFAAGDTPFQGVKTLLPDMG